MKTIPLTRGLVAVVDDEDHDCLSAFRWHAKPTHRGRFYAARNSPWVKGRHWPIWMHHEVLRPGAGQEIDHIDGDGLNNRRSNLRPATRMQNQRNQRVVRGRSGFKGVSMNYGRWVARIRVEGQLIHIGCFGSPVIAAMAYDHAAHEYFGEHACTNADLGLLP